MRHHRPIVLLAVAAVMGMTACGDDGPTTDLAAGTPTSTTTPTAALDDGVLTVELTDFAFGGLPESVPAGTKLAVENTSATELHEIVALRIQDGETRPADELVALPEAELLAAAGPVPATVLLAAPGAPQVAALGDGTLAEPGRYLVLCAIPTGVDPDEFLDAAAAAPGGPPDVPGGPPHFVHGMVAELIVE